MKSAFSFQEAAPSFGLLTTMPARLVDVEHLWQQAAEAAITLGEHALLRDLCTVMRAHRPQHLDARYYEARLAMAQQDIGRAEPILESLLKSDPEHWPARWALGGLLLLRGESRRGLDRCREAAVGGGPFLERTIRQALPASILPTWQPRTARSQEEQRLWDGALHHLLRAFEPDVPEPEEAAGEPAFRLLHAAILLEALWQGGALGSARRLAQRLLAKEPALVKPRLLLAEQLSTEGQVAEAMALLHDARVADPGGRVAGRLALPLLRAAFSTSPPEELLELLDRLPDSVRRAIEEGKVFQAPIAIELPRATMKKRGSRSTTTSSPVVQEIQSEINKLQDQVRRHLPPVTRTDLATAEAIVVAREPLVRLYGTAATQQILDELAALVKVIEENESVRPHLVLLDDAATLAPWKLERAEPANAGEIKGLLDRLEEKMEAHGERLAYVLLVGGHEIIPHHRLPNPVDDHDMDVPSDNPYATRGENYLIPARAVGRLPHEQDSPDLLLAQIRRLRTAWQESTLQGKGLIGDWFSNLTGRLPGARRALPPGESWGLAAQVWERAAQAVFRTLDNKSELLLTPPINAQRWEEEAPPSVPFYYFNVHGVEESGAWYGQVDPQQPAGEESYPVALTPAQLHKLSLERAIIFSEACYGANPHVSRAADSIALTAIQQGCALYVGSTKTAYASFAPPIMAADLLAALFWKAVAEGLPGGAALQQAKVQLAETMMRRTGYLDVEEQKTLTSFILYGDPALPLLRRPRHADPEALRQLAAKTEQKSIYQVSGKGVPPQALDPNILASIQQFAAPYLQGARGPLTMRSHPVSLTQTPPPLSGGHAGQAAQAKQILSKDDHWQITVSRSDEQQGITHRQVLTMKVNKSGKVLRTHVSR